MAICEVFHRLAITGIFDVVVVKNLGIPAKSYRQSLCYHPKLEYARKKAAM
jgi:hypothetical protein